MAFGPLSPERQRKGNCRVLRNKAYGIPLPHARTPCLAGYRYGPSRARRPSGPLFTNENSLPGVDFGDVQHGCNEIQAPKLDHH